MIRIGLVEECLATARAMLPNGPWMLVVADREGSIVDRKCFQVWQEAEARDWLLTRVQRLDRMPGLMAWYFADEAE